ncbi:MAG: DNA repair protein RecN [Acholeplasmataceae bacterium]
MLKRLKVSNFALIDDLEMTFEGGLTALTGETGTGKSIILESLQLLFGKRSDQTMIRHGATKALVSGTFILSDAVMHAFDLPETITIERSIDGNGRHQIRLEDEVTTLARIKAIMRSVGSIHNQNDTMALYDRSFYLTFIDQVDEKRTERMLNDYLLSRSKYLDRKKHFEDLKKKKSQSLEKKEFMEYQLKELKSLNLIEDEKRELEERIDKLKNFDKIQTNLRYAYEALASETSLDPIHEAGKSLLDIASLDENYRDMADRLTSAFYELDDVRSRIYRTLEELDFDEEDFDRMQERSYELQRIETKYDKSVNELIDYTHEIEEELSLIKDYDGYLKNYEKEVEKAYALAYDHGLKLRELRQKLARELEKEVLAELRDLDLADASFEIVFDPEDGQLHEHGLDSVEFYISLNEGEPLRPFSSVASGGERARFMFAIRSIYAKKNRLSLLILDEIDIGISGKTAAKVAQKMSELSGSMQLIVITHLPQVAARADHHYGISKIKEANRMVTRINELSEDERVEMIALMLSDEKLSHFAIEQARTLLTK